MFQSHDYNLALMFGFRQFALFFEISFLALAGVDQLVEALSHKPNGDGFDS